MKISRVEDKKFMITINEKEALELSDDSSHDFYDRKILTLRLGNAIADYLIESCKFPHDKRPTLELEVFSHGP